jgi:hypothetical protein
MRLQRSSQCTEETLQSRKVNHFGHLTYKDKHSLDVEELLRLFSCCKNVEEVYCSASLENTHYRVQSGNICANFLRS